MRRSMLASSLLLVSACLSRREVGVEPAQPCEACDAGTIAEQDAGRDERREVLAAFIRDLAGKWKGTSQEEQERLGRDIEIEFRLDGVYVARCLDEPGPNCRPFASGVVLSGTPGRYWITDMTLRGEFAGLTVDDLGGEQVIAVLDHIVLDGDHLTFERRQRFPWEGLEGPPTHVVLEREP